MWGSQGFMVGILELGAPMAYHCQKCDGVLDPREFNRGICDQCHKETSRSLPAWEKLPPLRRCYIRLLDPDGDVFDVWQNNLEATLEGLNDHHRVFRSNKKWQAFLDSQRAIATEWDLRNTLTDADRRFLDSLKISWEPLNMRARRYQLYGKPPLSLTTEQLADEAIKTVEQMSPAEKAKLRQQLDKGRFKDDVG